MRLLLLALLGATAVLAQSHGYVFAGGGAANGGFDQTIGLLHVGAGGEGVFHGVGAGGEVGLIGRTDLGALGTVSLNGSYHFRRQARAVPFVTGGYSRFFNFSGGVNLANVGFGVNYWFSNHVGLKLELRDHFRAGSASVNYVEVRFGATFR